MLGVIIVMIVMMGLICYSVLTYQLLKEHCPSCDKPARAGINWGFIYSKPFASRCIHCDAELKR